jgi:ribosome-associated protein
MIEDPGNTDSERPSKSERKRHSLELQSLGEALIELPPAELDELELPEALHDAIVAARTITSRGAMVRQRQYIGKLMRHVDAEPIRATLERRRVLKSARTREHHLVEQWRDRVLAEGEPALAALQEQYPDTDLREFRSLLRQAQAERESGRPSAAARRIFQRLRELLVPADE